MYRSGGQVKEIYEKLFRLLSDRNEKFNLTAIKSKEDFEVKHVRDSMLGLPYINGNVLDVGSGAGFPGLVIKIEKPETVVTLIDSVRKKTDYLSEAIKELGLENITAVHTRIEDMAGKESYDTVTARAGDYELLWVGEPKRGEMSVAAFAERVEAVLGRRPLVLGPTERTVRRVAWCSGAAQGEIGLAAALGADLFLSGEVSERTTYEAEELGVTYLAAGHHATEQFGIRALGRHLAERWPELDLRFFDTKNPV